MAQQIGIQTSSGLVKFGGSSGGHTIVDDSGTSMAQRSNLKIVGAAVTDDAVNDTTIIEIESGGGIELDSPTAISFTNLDEAVEIKWTDPTDKSASGIVLATWAGTLVVRKVGSAPVDKTDGTLIIDSKTRNQYQSTGFTDTGLTNGVTYYYGFFPYSTQKVYNYQTAQSFTPSIIYPTTVSDLEVSAADESAEVSWSVPSDATKVRIVYKAGSAPESDTDGAYFENVTSPHELTGLTNGTTYYFVAYSYNAKNRTAVSSAVSAVPKSLPIYSWSTATDAEIAEMVAAADAGILKLEDYWEVGQERSVSLSAMAATGVGESHVAQTQTFVLMDMDNDNYEYVAPPASGEARARFIVGLKNGLANGTSGEYGYMNSSNTNAGSWNNTARRTWCNNVFYNALPSALKPIFKQVKVKTASEYNASTLQTTQDYFFLPAAKEVFGGTATSAGSATSYSNLTEFNALTQWEYYQTSANRIKKQGDNGSANAWWERSPHYDHATHFCRVDSSGGAGSGGASGTRLIAPVGCI